MARRIGEHRVAGYERCHEAGVLMTERDKSTIELVSPLLMEHYIRLLQAGMDGSLIGTGGRPVIGRVVGNRLIARKRTRGRQHAEPAVRRRPGQVGRQRYERGDEFATQMSDSPVNQTNMNATTKGCMPKRRRMRQRRSPALPCREERPPSSRSGVTGGRTVAS